MTARVAINGFGRTGRQALKAIWRDHGVELEVAAIGLHRLDGAAAAAHLLQHDSNYGHLGMAAGVEDSTLVVGPHRIPLVAAATPGALPWRDLGVDIVVESSGAFATADQAAGHLAAGARKVVVTAPCAGADCTMIYGLNETAYDAARHHVVSADTETTNALAVVLSVLTEALAIESALVTSVRAYTNEQKLLDAADEDLRQARSAPVSIVPTGSRAATAVAEVVPSLVGRIQGYAVRVPVPVVSIVELTMHLREPAPATAINDALRQAARGPIGRVLAVSDDPLVSSDYRGSRYSAVVDAPLTITIGPLAKVSAWYDNEWGYACRVADVTAVIAAQLEPRP